MKRHFLETVNIEKGLVALHGKYETTVRGSGVDEGSAILCCGRLLERGEGCSGYDIMK